MPGPLIFEISGSRPGLTPAPTPCRPPRCSPRPRRLPTTDRTRRLRPSCRRPRPPTTTPARRPRHPTTPCPRTPTPSYSIQKKYNQN